MGPCRQLTLYAPPAIAGPIEPERARADQARHGQPDQQRLRRLLVHPATTPRSSPPVGTISQPLFRESGIRHRVCNNRLPAVVQRSTCLVYPMTQLGVFPAQQQRSHSSKRDVEYPNPGERVTCHGKVCAPERRPVLKPDQALSAVKPRQVAPQRLGLGIEPRGKTFGQLQDNSPADSPSIRERPVRRP